MRNDSLKSKMAVTGAALLLAVPASATIILIPVDYPTIQQGIDASTDGDTVLVGPGTYVENIEIYGHNLVLGSFFLITGDDSFIYSTIIDGDSSGSVLKFLGDIDSTTIVTGFILQNGNAYFGGGIYCYNSNPGISHNIIRDNLAFGFEVSIVGGGIFCSSSNARILNNTITGNIAIGSYGSYGGGIYCEESSPTIANNTISGNSAESGAGISCFLVSYPIIMNTILWGDSALYNAEIDFDDSSSPFFIYCDIEGGWGGEGNIDVDPLFRDPDNGDFRLMSSACGDPYDSPCIDAGDPAIIDSLLDCSWGLGTILSDIGAYGGGDSVTVAIDEFLNLIPKRLALTQNYPNPFNAATVISFSIPEARPVTITIYDLLGREVQILLDDYRQAGIHHITFDASDLASGIYFYRLQARESVETKRMVLLK